MPIARDFFHTFFQMPISENQWVLWGKLITFLRDTRGLNSLEAIDKANLDIEEVMSDIGDRLADPALIHPERIILTGVYNELIYLFSCVVNGVANGPVSTPHAELAQWLEPGDAIVTFNWDVVMDKALQANGKWSVDTGYGFTPKSVYRDGWNAPEEKPSKHLLLKLHGSANWLTSTTFFDGDKPKLAHTLPPEACFIFEGATEPYPCWKGRYMEGYGPLTCGYYPPNLETDAQSAPKGFLIAQVSPKFPWTIEGTAPDHGLVSAPLMIAPEKKKKYEFYGTLFQSLWKQAQEALTKCDEIVSIGYSFPQTDIRTRELVKQAFIARGNVPKVTIIDPTPQRARDAFKLDFGIPESMITIRAEGFEGQKSLQPIK